MDEYKELLKRYKEIHLISQISQLLGWDQETYMPKGAVNQRGEQSAYLAKLRHKKITDPEIGRLLKTIKEHADFEKLSPIEKRNIELIEREYERETKVPIDFVEEFAKLTVISTDKWKTARMKNDFGLFKPYLLKVFEMSQQYANYINPDEKPYEVLLDLYERGMTTAKYDAIFNPLKDATVVLIEKCLHVDRKPDVSIIKRKVPINIQEQLSNEAMKILNYDLTRGRLDTTAHPFTTGAYDDVRITTRYDENDFTGSFFAVMHEAGHACYEQHQKTEWRYQPVGNSCSMGVHESQSRFYENIIGRSKAFWTFFFPKFQQITGDIFKDVAFDDFMLAINRVEPSLIRVEADEVTYNLHIILRFEFERDLFTQKITVEELPELWKERMNKMLGVTVPNDSLGVLQDIHWSFGSFGYFPTYSMGNVYGAQFFAKMKKDIPNWDEELRNGKVSTITDWLKHNVHELGNLYDPPMLVEQVTGEQPSHKYLVDYLTTKYQELYQF